jgi:hypothetical protein
VQNNDQRPTMKDIIIIVLGVSLMIAVLINIKPDQGRIYDCGMAEWHPDIPNRVKEECRRLHYEDWKRQQEENKKLTII